jgi:hypothetical protein
MRGHPLSEDIKKLLSMRDDLAERIEKLKEEISDLQRALEQIDNLILEEGGGFKRASAEEKAAPTVVAEEKAAIGESVPIKARDGKLLATVYLTEKELKVAFAEDLVLTSDIPPFQSFLLDRVLAGMRTSDEDRIRRGEITPDEALSFQVEAEGNRLTSLTIQNYGGERRLREIRSSVRWTLERMYEKLASSA